MYSIGELSRRTQVKVPTIRYYEQTGLVDAPERTAGNQRRYGEPALRRLSFIRHARDLGFGVEAIRELIDLSRDPAKPCAEADQIANAHLRAVEQRIARLTRLKSELERISTACPSGTMADCRVIEAIADHALCEGEH